jgi:hypothetical protein
MGRQVAVVLYVVAMAAVIVGVDFVFFRNRFRERHPPRRRQGPCATPPLGNASTTTVSLHLLPSATSRFKVTRSPLIKTSPELIRS